MPSTSIVTVLCPDKTGLVAAITATLSEMGANLADTSFSVLGGGADFSCICEMPAGLEIREIDAALTALPELAGAEITVRPYIYEPLHGPEGDVTHRITISGGDQPGLVARFCETFGDFKANIVSLHAGPLSAANEHYVIRLAVSIPAGAADACISTVVNTAEALGLTCLVDTA